MTPIANALFDLLAIKVQEGVEVRALFDAFGNWSNSKPLKKRHLKAIRDRGIEIVKFDPIPSRGSIMPCTVTTGRL